MKLFIKARAVLSITAKWEFTQRVLLQHRGSAASRPGHYSGRRNERFGNHFSCFRSLRYRPFGFATVHTTSAAKTVDRIIEVFPASEQLQIRSTLADGLRAVVSQVIFKRIDVRTRCVALEILIANSAGAI